MEIDVVATEGSRGVVEGARAAVASLLEGLEVMARSATAIPIEPSGKFRVSKRHFPLDTAACFEGC